MGASWFIRPDPRHTARLRLFCFPHAGGGASTYGPWKRLLPPEIDLCIAQAPGRESRLREPPVENFSELIEAFAERIGEYLDLPFAFFGHSMGAGVAFELARKIATQTGLSPTHLFISARRAPRLPERYPPLHVLTDDDFVIQIRNRFGGIPDEVMRHPDLLALLLPGLRADIAAMERHRFDAEMPLACDITAFGGIDDPTVTSEELAGWSAETNNRFEMRLFSGGHFFVHADRANVVSAVVETLRCHALNSQLEPSTA